MHGFRRLSALGLIALSSTAGLAANGAGALDDGLARTTVFAVTESHALVSFRAAAPATVLSRVDLSGLAADEHILGIDYRVAHGVMFALGSSGRVYTVDVASGVLEAVGATAFDLPLQGQKFGFDFNPAADRIRIVSDSGQNLRAHPESGALVDGRADEQGLQPDDALAFERGDINAGREPSIVAAAYTYNNRDETITTNFAIDLGSGSLVRQGSVEGAQPVVSPNTGRLSTVGTLGVDGIADAHFDISDVSNTAVAALSTAGDLRYRLFEIELATGKAREVGLIANGESLRGIAIEP